MIDLGFYIFYVLFAIAVGSALIFSIVNALKVPGALLRSAIGIGVILVLFGVAYAISGSEVTLKASAAGITPSSSKLIGGGLIMFYIVLGLAVLTLIYSEINKALK